MRFIIIALTMISCGPQPPATKYITNYIMDFDNSTPLERESAINTIDQINNHFGCTKVTFSYGTRVLHSVEIIHTINFIDEIKLPEEESASGVTSHWDRAGYRESDILVQRLHTDLVDKEPILVKEIYERIIIHEIGHSLGLEHTEKIGTVMYPRQVAFPAQRLSFHEWAWQIFMSDLKDNGVFCAQN